jgi:GNAT superfamily N-acetyltransferase
MHTFEIINHIKDFKQALPLLMLMYPDYSEEDFENMLKKMLPHQYQILLYKIDHQVVGLTGFWLGTKFWSGKYCEIDNLIIHADYRNKGIGKKIVEKITELSIVENCKMVTLDAYTHNFKAHKFFYQEGFVAKGFHFVKNL